MASAQHIEIVTVLKLYSPSKKLVVSLRWLRDSVAPIVSQVIHIMMLRTPFVLRDLAYVKMKRELSR